MPRMPWQQFDMQKSGQSETGGRFLRSEEKRKSSETKKRAVITQAL